MQLNELLAQVDSLKAEIDKLRPLKPEVEHRVMQKFRLDWNYHSNAIEGNTLTLGETRAFLYEGLTANGKPLKDHLDIKGHDDLITFLEEFIRRKDRLTEAAVREMHKILLKESIVTFIGQNLFDAESLYLRGARGESIEDADDIDKSLRLLKQELANVEEPQEISQERLTRVLIESVEPLTVRLAEKLKQFDDFYSNESVYFNTELYVDGKFGGYSGGSPHSGSKGRIKALFAGIANLPIRKLAINFHWEGFRKAGFNDFSKGIHIEFTFERRKYTVSSQSTNFQRRLLYQQQLSDDESAELISGLAKFCLSEIKKELERSRQ